MREKLNCPNCGAPISGAKCEYCGTQFFDIADIEPGKAGFIRLKLGDQINVFRAIPQVSIEYSSAPETYYFDNEPIEVHTRHDMTVTVELTVVPDEEGAIWRKRRIHD